MRRLLLPLLAVLPATALAQVPFGPEFRVNGYTFRYQRMPKVAADEAGRFVVVWHRESENYGGEGIFGQRLDPAGRPLGGEFRVSNPDAKYPPSLAVAIDGSFVVAWSTGLLYQEGIFARRFGSTGAPLGPQFLVNTSTAGLQYEPDLALDAGGGFVVVWTGDDGSITGVRGQRFDGAGNRRGSEFAVNSYTTSFQRWPSVAVAPSGPFMVVWVSDDQNGVSWQVFGRRYDAQGTPGPEIQLDSYTSNTHFAPQVAVDGAGNFVVVWEDQYRHVLTGRRLDAGGNPLGGEFTIAGQSAYDAPTRPAVAADPPGFVVVWEGYGPGFSDIFARRFDAAATPGPTFRVNQYRSVSQEHPSVAPLPGRGVVAAWWERNGDPVGIIARRFGDLGPSALVSDTAPAPTADGNGVLEPGEAVAVRPTWRNSTAVPRPASGTVSQISGPGAPSLYSIVDSAASYGTLPANGSGSCAGAGDCYAVRVAAPATRPAAHWDATVREDVVASGLVPPAVWALHVGDSFADVPRASPFYRFVETLVHRSVTSGCQAGLYCPQSAVTREQMAVFVLAGVEAPWYKPPECPQGTPKFPDVPQSSPFCRWIGELARRDIASGCGGGNYCPADSVTREQMAVFVLRAFDPLLDPPACTTPMFVDVPGSSPFCRWIEELARRGVVTGCGGGNYCPAAPVSRQEMSVFITVTFGLTLYGP